VVVNKYIIETKAAAAVTMNVDLLPKPVHNAPAMTLASNVQRLSQEV
jgi:hypothetical protein